jgi:peptidoglycan/LPS O-acetylase OafA/YrhL
MTARPAAASVYFPGLDGLRFFAALAVALSHVELMKQYHGYPSAYERPAVYELGRLAVTLFFVLSGYLITYLLLEEKKLTGDISVRHFYVRRLLRIWPLYYLVVGLAFFVFPHVPALVIPRYSAEIGVHMAWTFPLFLFLLPQLALSVYDPVPLAEPVWSIGVEEQFYLLWPLLMRRFRSFLALALLVIAASLSARYLALAMATASRAGPARLLFWNQVINYFYFTRIECMAIGGIFAWVVFRRPRRVVAFLHDRRVQAVVYALTAWLLVTDAFKPIFTYALPAVCFAVLILNVSTNPRSLIRLPGRAFTFLGNISFSVYMFHEVAIQLTLYALVTGTGTRFADAGSNVALYAASMLLTGVIATVSYLFFERPFLRLKARFGVIASGADAGQPGAARAGPSP